MTISQAFPDQTGEMKIRSVRQLHICLLIAGACLVTTACKSQEDDPTGRDLCSIGTSCQQPAPPPLELFVSSEPAQVNEELRRLLNHDFSKGGRVYEFGPEKPKSWMDRRNRKHLPLRLYFVVEREQSSIGSLWVVYDHIEDEVPKTQIIARGLDTSRLRFVTDGIEDNEYRQLGLYRIAAVDKQTGIGPTFVSGYPQRPYIRHEYDSEYVRHDWERAITSSCGGGPLTAVSQKWVDERNRRCEASRDR